MSNLNGFFGLSPKLASVVTFLTWTVGIKKFAEELIGICLPAIFIINQTIN
jgi:hypothetical protein